jgi:hypothetical protein
MLLGSVSSINKRKDSHTVAVMTNPTNPGKKYGYSLKKWVIGVPSLNIFGYLLTGSDK